MQQESMFGPSPLAVQDQLDQQFLQQNSSLDLGSMSARAGLAMGKGINGLLGREDPRVAEAKAVQEAVQELRQSGVSMDDPVEYYKRMAGIFSSKGLTKQAEQAAMKSLEAKDKADKRTFDTKDRDMQLQIKEGTLAIEKVKLQAAIAKAKGRLDGPEFVEMLDKLYKDASVESKTKALDIFLETGDISKARAALQTKRDNKLIGTTPDGLAVYVSPEDEQYTIGPNKTRIPYTGAVKTIGGITNDMRTDNAEQKAAGTEFEMRFRDHNEAIKAASSVATEMQKMRDILKSGKLVTGSLPEQQATLMRLAATVGFPLTKEQVETLDNTDQFDAMVTNVILPKMKMLGGNDSEQELKVIRESTGSRKFTKESLGQILAVMEKAVKKRYQLEADYRKHVQAGKGRTNFNFYPEATTQADIPAPTSAPVPAQSSQPTGIPGVAPQAVNPGPKVITEARIQKYIAFVKETSGKDITKEQAIERLKASLPKGQ